MKYITLFLIFLSCGSIKSIQEDNSIQLEILSYEKKENLFKIQVSNTSANNLWFETSYLFITSIINDDTGQLPSIYKNIKQSRFVIPNYVLIKPSAKGEIILTKIIIFPYVLEEGKNYCIYFNYQGNGFEKKDKFIKTFKGNITNIKPLKIVY